MVSYVEPDRKTIVVQKTISSSAVPSDTVQTS